MIGDDGKEVKEGQTWYIRAVGEKMVAKMYISDLTSFTIEVRPDLHSARAYRYTHDQLHMIEKVEP